MQLHRLATITVIALSAALIANTDTEYHLAMVKAYNDWISEFVAHAPTRFGGLAILPNRGGVQESVAEIARVLDRPGMRGIVMGCYPNGTLEIEPEDDLDLRRFDALRRRLKAGGPADDTLAALKEGSP